MVLLQFSQGMTALSLFVPLIAVSVAFWFLGDEAEYSWWRIPFAGVFVGLTSKSSCARQSCTATTQLIKQSSSCTTAPVSRCPTSSPHTLFVLFLG